MYNLIKRIFDIVMSIIGILVLPFIVVYVIALKIIYKDNTPLFFTQQRISKNGKIFKIYKFNTMIENAQNELESMIENDEKIKEEYFKYKKIQIDKRVTKVGEKTRGNNIDEWPQFVNVIFGSMSIVGPRPYLVNEKNDIPKTVYENIAKVKPGITGMWQIDMGNKTFKERLNIDNEYVKNKNLVLDFKIFLLTIKKILS